MKTEILHYSPKLSVIVTVIVLTLATMQGVENYTVQYKLELKCIVTG